MSADVKVGEMFGKVVKIHENKQLLKTKQKLKLNRKRKNHITCFGSYLLAQVIDCGSFVSLLCEYLLTEFSLRCFYIAFDKKEPIEEIPEEVQKMNKMSRIVRKHKTLILLFVCGFFIGIFLEVILIEFNKLNLRSEYESLKQEVQVTCLVLLKHEHMRYVNYSKNTWLKHCQQYHIIDVQRPSKLGKRISKSIRGAAFSEGEISHNPVRNDKTCSREYVESEKKWKIVGKSGWSGLCKAIHITRHSHNHWLIIVPDSLVVLVENLKLFVKDLNYDDDHYYGYGLQNYEADYNVLSAGIVLSRGAVKKLLEKFKFEKDCDLSGRYWRNEDLYLGKYLKEMAILPKDTRDNEGRGRFHGYNLNNVLWPGKIVNQTDYRRKALYPVPQGFNCCSPYLITMDMSDPDAIYNFYFFLYRLKTFHNEWPKSIHPKKTDGFFWKDFLREEGYNESAIENMTSEEYYKIWEKKLPPDVMYREMRNFIKNSKKTEV